MIDEEQESYAASRVGGIGGTDVAAILGLSPWRKPIDIYSAKVDPQGQAELDKELLWWGSALEPIVRDRFGLRFGLQVTPPSALGGLFPQSKPWRDSTLIIGREPWMIGAPDGWISSENDGLEVKCSARKTGEWGDEGSDTVPANYYTQVSWYMAVCEAKGWDFAVLFSGNSLQRYHIKRDLIFERNLIEVARSFWFDFVIPQIEPPIDQTESYGLYLARKFSLGTGMVISNPSPEILEQTAMMKLASADKKAAEDRERLANNNLRALVGDAQKAITPMGTIGWIRPEEKEVTDWEAVGKKIGPLHPEIIAEFTQKMQRAASFRAWWKK